MSDGKEITADSTTNHIRVVTAKNVVQSDVKNIPLCDIAERFHGGFSAVKSVPWDIAIRDIMKPHNSYEGSYSCSFAPLPSRVRSQSQQPVHAAITPRQVSVDAVKRINNMRIDIAAVLLFVMSWVYFLRIFSTQTLSIGSGLKHYIKSVRSIEMLC